MPDELEDARQAKGDDIFPETFQPSSSSILPDGWIVEDIPRKTSFRSDRVSSLSICALVLQKTFSSS